VTNAPINAQDKLVPLTSKKKSMSMNTTPDNTIIILLIFSPPVLFKIVYSFFSKNQITGSLKSRLFDFYLL